MDPMALLKGLCLMSGAALHVAPLPTMREIQTARSTLNYHIAPYASTLLNHLVNFWYAIVREDGPLIVHRIAGITAQTYYLYTYMKHSAPTKANDNKNWLTRVTTILGVIFIHLHILLPMLGLSETYYRPHIAFFGAITGIGLAASPLATVKEVLRNKDASSLPPMLCSMVTLQCFCWSVYGYYRNDLSTLSNNVVGVCLGSIQLTLIAIYGNKRGTIGPSKSNGHSALATTLDTPKSNSGADLTRLNATGADHSRLNDVPLDEEAAIPGTMSPIEREGGGGGVTARVIGGMDSKHR